MSARRGYETVNNDHETDQPQEAEPILNSSLTPPHSTSILQHVRNYYHEHGVSTLIIGAVILFLILIFSLATFLPSTHSNSYYGHIQAPMAPGISSITLQHGLSKCRLIAEQSSIVESTAENRQSNPRAPKDIQPVLIKHAVVWDGEGEILNNADILMSNGVIAEVKQGIQAPSGSKIIDVAGHIVSPGIVDMHTHLGVSSWLSLKGTSDINEMTQPAVPFVRAIDAFNPSDKAIRIVASGGITTALVLPGSSNLIGGEAYAFKLRPVDTLSNEDMLVQAGINKDEEHKWRYMKMACGENPKNNYGAQHRMPSTRLGEAYLFRKSFADAKALIEAQENWCSAAENLSNSLFDIHTQPHLSAPFPEDLSLESLTALLRGQVKLNIHCYETHDIEAMIRHSIEFNFNISAFHHALEAYKIPSILRRARNNITIATFADHWGFKKEAFGASPHAPRLLYEAGIPVALKSDHPVLNSQHMAFEAAKAGHYGLPLQEAFKAITSVPARTLGLGHRVGSLKIGYDADVVIWDRSPLDLGAAPLQVFIDGVPLFDEKPIESVKSSLRSDSQSTLVEKISNSQLEKLPKEGSNNYILTNIGLNLLNDASSIVIKEGKIVCADSQCMNAVDTAKYEMIDIEGGYILPGLIAVGSKLGMAEMISERTTIDGIAPATSSHDPKAIIEAVDGLKLGGKKLQEAYKGGVLTTITSPVSRNIVMGVSVAFKTSAESLLNDGSLISSAAALHLQIGDSVKSTEFPTISSQISYLRQIFTDNLQLNNRYGQAARGEIPLIIIVNNKDEIASLIKLKEKTIPKAKLAIMGGAESHLLAARLAKANIAVILRPALCTPDSYDSSNCLTGAPLTNGTAAHILHSYGVKIGLGISNDGWARNLAWDAGWLAATSPSQDLKITERDAVKFVTTNLQEIFGLKRDDLMQSQDFVVWSGSPLDMQSKPLFTHTNADGIHYLL